MYLKSCPICGGEAALSEAVADRTGYYCECYACGKSTDEYAGRNQAAEAWNRSEAKDLKDTEMRGVYAVVMKPLKTWWQVFYRTFFLLFGLIFAFTIIATLNAEAGDPPILFIGMYVFGAVWLAGGLFFFVRFSRRQYAILRRLCQKERAENLIATVLSYILALCAHVALFLFVIAPFIETCQNTSVYFR